MTSSALLGSCRNQMCFRLYCLSGEQTQSCNVRREAMSLESPRYNGDANCESVELFITKI